MEIDAEIRQAMAALDERDPASRALWDQIAIEPVRWRCVQYGEDEEVWVVAVMGNQCVYYNEIEEGWGWGNFTSWGTILGHHWQQDEIHHVILKALDGMRKQSLPIDDATALNEQ